MKKNTKYPNMAKAIKESGLTIAEVMNKAGYNNPRAYYSWQRGVGMPVTAVINIAKVLNVSVDYLLDFNQEQAS